MTRPVVWDVGEVTVVVGCSCLWRTVAPSELAAMRAYRDHRAERHATPQALTARTRAKARAHTCGLCGATGDVEPFAGLCPRCRKAHRATLARQKYQATKKTTA